MPNTKRAEVPFGDNLTPPQRVSRMLEIIDDLLPLADLSQEGFYASDTREEATAYAAALGRAGSKLPPSFQNDHPEIDWAALEDLRRISFHDGIDVLMLRDQLQRVLPTLQAMLENFLDETPTTEPEP
jgi:uncharacterized protein with HEPN domain